MNNNPKAERMVLTDEYYNQCHKIFRSQTNQQGLMLEAMLEAMKGQRDLRILSVGSGLGLFERPLLEGLIKRGIAISYFVGIDINASASEQFEKALRKSWGEQLKFDVRVESFEDYASQESFDLILFNHVFEYIEDQHAIWLKKAMNLLNENGMVALFSPLSGGINHYYEHFSKHYFDRAPFFSDDLVDLLAKTKLVDYSKQSLTGICNIHLLGKGGDVEEKIKLLSFLCQIDCRKLPEKEIEEVIDYFQALTSSAEIAHPSDFFRIRKA